MKTLNELFAEINDPGLIFALGGVSVAHGDRARARAKLRVAEAELIEARAARNKLFGFYGSDGEITALDSAETHIRFCLDEKRSKEKHFKKLCYTYVEMGGNRQHIDEMIEIITATSD